MAPVEVTDDYYAILQVSSDANNEIIRKSYLRLAFIRHPDKNPTDPGAKAAFQLVNLTPLRTEVPKISHHAEKAANTCRKLLSAYETLKSPDTRRLYNIRWRVIRQNQPAQNTREEAKKPSSPHAHAEHERDADEAEKRRQKDESARRERQQRLDVLRSKYEGDIFEVNRVIRRLAAELESQQREEEADLRKERPKNGWWAYLTSPISGEAKETEEQSHERSREREIERLRRLACKRVKETQLAEKQAIIQTSKDALNQVNIKIAAIIKEREDETRRQANRRQEQYRKVEEARRRAEEEERRKREEEICKEAAEWLAKWRKQQEEADARATKAAREAREAQKEQRRRSQEEQETQAAKAAHEAREAKREQMRKEQAEWEEPRKRYEQAAPRRTARKARQPEESTPDTDPYHTFSYQSICRHEQFWPRLEGRRQCDQCYVMQARFTFQCPGCDKTLKVAGKDRNRHRQRKKAKAQAQAKIASSTAASSVLPKAVASPAATLSPRGWFPSPPPNSEEEDVSVIATDEIGMVVGEGSSNVNEDAPSVDNRKTSLDKPPRKYVSKHFKVRKRRAAPTLPSSPPLTPQKHRIIAGVNIDELSTDSDLTDVPDDIGPDPFDFPTKPAKVKAVNVKHPSRSPYFAHRPRPQFLSCLPFPPLSDQAFGLMQERLAHDPFRLLIATIFLNKTPGQRAMPVFYQLMERYPTPADLSRAEVADVTGIIQKLGFQNQRARKCVEMAKLWVERPPVKGKRYRKLNYPRKGDHRNVKVEEVVGDEDERVAWEISHLSGLGPYSHDSWRMFCRDKLRGVAKGYLGESAEDGFEPEWKKVVPTDKELRAWLTWMWLKEGWAWNKETGERTKADEELMERARGGGIVQEKAQTDHLLVTAGEEPHVQARAVEKPAGEFMALGSNGRDKEEGRGRIKHEGQAGDIDQCVSGQ